MTSNEDGYDFLNDISQFFTQVTYNFINHTNIDVGGSKIKAKDLKNFSEDEWNKYFQDHIENYRLICTDFFKNGFVFVDMEMGKTKKDLIITLKDILVLYFSQKSEGSGEVVADEETTENARTGFQDSSSSFPAELLFSSSSQAKTATEFPENNLDEPDVIDPSFEVIPQKPDEREEVVADRTITEEGKDLIQNELNKLEDVRNAEDKAQKVMDAEQESPKPDRLEETAKNDFHGNEQKLPMSDTEKDYQTCQMGDVYSEPEPVADAPSTFDLFDLQIEDPQQSSKSQEFTDYLTDMLGSLKRPETVPDADEVQEDLIVTGHILSLDEGFQQVYSSATDFSSPSATEFLINPSDNEVTKLKPLKDSFDDPEEVDPSFEQKMKEQNKAFMEKMAEKKRKREEKQKKFQEELNEIRKQQKQCFAALLACIQLKHRFEEKEQDVASWIKNCCKEPVLKLLRGFEDFTDTAREWKYFKKVTEDSIQDARSEIEGLHGKACFLLDILRTSFDQLEQLSGMAPDALFLRVLQKSICDLADVLNSILDTLEETQTDNGWYQKLEDSFLRIRPEKIPTTTMLKRICQKGSGVEYENLRFPERQLASSVVIQEDEEGDILEQKIEQDPMECKISLTDHLSTQNSVQKYFQEDQKTEEFDSFPTDNLEHQTKGTSTPQSNRKRSSDPAFLNSSLAMTPTNDFQKESRNSRTEKKPKHFHMNLVN